jgi:hypothetical protein
MKLSIVIAAAAALLALCAVTPVQALAKGDCIVGETVQWKTCGLPRHGTCSVRPSSLPECACAGTLSPNSNSAPGTAGLFAAPCISCSVFHGKAGLLLLIAAQPRAPRRAVRTAVTPGTPTHTRLLGPEQTQFLPATLVPHRAANHGGRPGRA